MGFLPVKLKNTRNNSNKQIKKTSISPNLIYNRLHIFIKISRKTWKFYYFINQILIFYYFCKVIQKTAISGYQN